MPLFSTATRLKMFPRYWIALLFALFCTSALACRQHPLTNPENVRISGDSVMIVVHQSSTYDARFSTKRGVDEAVRFAKSEKIPVIYLKDDTPETYYFMKDCAPDYWVYSGGGEVTFDVPVSNLYIVGGHLEHCMSTALHDILYQWAQRAPRNYTVTYFMDAIYSNGKMIEPGAPFYADFERFMNVVTYGRPGGEHWPKLSLLETMGIIVDQDDELEYIKSILPRWDTTFSKDYRVEVRLNDSVTKVLRAGKGWKPPTLSFRFLDSALDLLDPPPSMRN
ncbi:hypothetical protein [Propionivibrio soli]|uniref:hypothetical protein n=1 Tax=Propionivibrio soli TaxID=2976531 RepID=UPI0021E88798|nr:hypothetical protein [Propionivibrio soli]